MEIFMICMNCQKSYKYCDCEVSSVTKVSDTAAQRPALSEDEAVEIMQKAASHEYEKILCMVCNGSGREQDSTPCSNPNYAADCRECSGDGFKKKYKSNYDKIKSAYRALIAAGFGRQLDVTTK